MTYTTPNEQAAYIEGMTVAAYEAAQDAADAFTDTYGDADLDREDQRFVDYSDVEDPDTGHVRRYGWDHSGIYYEGAYGG